MYNSTGPGVWKGKEGYSLCVLLISSSILPNLQLITLTHPRHLLTL
jgi:hypothetical protein